MQIGSYKLIEKLIIPNLDDSSILKRSDVDFETTLKMIIFARVLASQGAYKRSLTIYENIKEPILDLEKRGHSSFLFKTLFYFYLFNGNTKKSIEALDLYSEFVKGDMEKSVFFLSMKVMVYFLEKKHDLAKEAFRHLQDMDCKNSYQLDLERVLKFSINTLESVVDEEGFIHAEAVLNYVLDDSYKIFIRLVQLEYLIILNDPQKIIVHVEKIFKLKMEEGSACIFLRRVIVNELQKYKYLKMTIHNFRIKFLVLAGALKADQCLEICPTELRVADYYTLLVKENQLDLVAGIIYISGKTDILTELQRKCLTSIIKNGEFGISGIVLAEILYPGDLNIKTSLDSLRKIVSKLRSMSVEINYLGGRYFFINTFHSVLCTEKEFAGDLLSFVRRHSQSSFFNAENASCILGLKKSRTSEYLRIWLKNNLIKAASSDGNKKNYQILEAFPFLFLLF